MTATFTNAGASAVFGYFQADIVASAVSGIPGPSTLSMTGAGIALALAAALRRLATAWFPDVHRAGDGPVLRFHAPQYRPIDSIFRRVPRALGGNP